MVESAGFARSACDVFPSFTTPVTRAGSARLVRRLRAARQLEHRASQLQYNYAAVAGPAAHGEAIQWSQSRASTPAAARQQPIMESLLCGLGLGSVTSPLMTSGSTISQHQSAALSYITGQPRTSRRPFLAGTIGRSRRRAAAAPEPVADRSPRAVARRGRLGSRQPAREEQRCAPRRRRRVADDGAAHVPRRRHGPVAVRPARPRARHCGDGRRRRS